MKPWYFLDEDCRKATPETAHCARCKKRIKDAQRGDSFFRIALHPKEMYFRKLGPTEAVAANEQEALLGSDCWRKIQEWGTYYDLNGEIKKHESKGTT